MDEELLTHNSGQTQIIKMKTKDTKEKKTLIPIKIKPKKHVMSLMDTLLTLFLVTPLIVGTWQGTWDLMNVYENAFPPWESFFLGNAFHITFALGRERLQSFIQFKSRNWFKMVFVFFVRRLYTYLFTVVCIMNWRGGWIIYDEWLSCKDYKNVSQSSRRTIVILTVVIIGCLVLLRSLRSILSVPFVIALDTKTTAFDFPTRFNKKMGEKTLLYILDCLFSVFVIGTLVVFVWRGVWVLMDIYLFPENDVWSAFASLILGYGTVALTFLMQPVMRWICDRIEGYARLLAADIFLFVSFVGTINVWRGIWNLLNLYFIPENLELSSWITHWVCLILLILLKCSNTLIVRGVYIDAEEPAGKCVVFPIYYLRLIFQHERAKKISKKFQLEAMARKKMELEGIKPTCTCGVDIINHVGNNIQENSINEKSYQIEKV